MIRLGGAIICAFSVFAANAAYAQTLSGLSIRPVLEERDGAPRGSTFMLTSGYVSYGQGLFLSQPVLAVSNETSVNQRFQTVAALHGPAAWWQWGWVAMHGATIAGAAGYGAINDDTTNRVAMVSMAGKSAISLGLSLIWPHPCAFRPAQTGSDGAITAHAFDRYIQKCRVSVEKKTGWLPHVLNVGVNIVAAVASYAYLANQDKDSQAYDSRFTNPLIGMVLGIAVIETKILTTPAAVLELPY